MTEDDRGPAGPMPAAESGDVSVRPAPAARTARQELVDRQFTALVEHSLGEAQPSPAPRWEIVRSRLTFADVCGVDAAKRRLQHLFAQGRSPRSRGVVLYGPAGCGKSLLARALAGQLGAGFLHVTVADLVHPALGADQADVTALFGRLSSAGPVVLLLDGIDALPTDGPGREIAVRIAAELEALAADTEVVVVASTDRPWAVHPLLRATRALRTALFVPPPSRSARRELFRVLLPQRTSPGVSTRRLARCTNGLSGADIAAICAHAGEEAALDAIAGHPRLIKMADLAAANAQTPRTVRAWSDQSRQARLAA